MVDDMRRLIQAGWMLQILPTAHFTLYRTCLILWVPPRRYADDWFEFECAAGEFDKTLELSAHDLQKFLKKGGETV